MLCLGRHHDGVCVCVCTVTVMMVVVNPMGLSLNQAIKDYLFIVKHRPLYVIFLGSPIIWLKQQSRLL